VASSRRHVAGQQGDTAEKQSDTREGWRVDRGDAVKQAGQKPRQVECRQEADHHPGQVTWPRDSCPTNRMQRTPGMWFVNGRVLEI